MNYLKFISFAALAVLLAANVAMAQNEAPWASIAKTTFTPKVHHPNIASVTLFAENPDIVTPVGIAVAPDGRVFVQENHTHKRNSNYKGPTTDRILVFEDTDGVVFYIDKDDVEERRELTTSLMPSGLLNEMNASEIRDLIAYLLHGDKS